MPSHSNMGHRGQCLRIKNFSDFDSVKNWNSIRISQDQELELYKNKSRLIIKNQIIKNPNLRRGLCQNQDQYHNPDQYPDQLIIVRTMKSLESVT